MFSSATTRAGTPGFKGLENIKSAPLAVHAHARVHMRAHTLERYIHSHNVHSRCIYCGRFFAGFFIGLTHPAVASGNLLKKFVSASLAR
jgi:hypothetical protein